MSEPPENLIDRTKALIFSRHISYIAFPEASMDLYPRRLCLYSHIVPNPKQLMLAAFIPKGRFERHINRPYRYHFKQREVIVNTGGPYPCRESPR